ncbi:MAG: hypothetical protein A3A22_03695 [Candidatus Taylorbacteria bacterium RIFCSPLOWO2_01_FULL_45_34b]|nr:MAG: hypothetical protein A3A22_03695 [Candidatus Taylorbacteria bacterium RIFCSPLOWO2_01_FULL_45_34b]
MTLIDEKVLENAGLSPEQSRLYLSLLEGGLSSARHLASKTNLGRALTYKILGQLTYLKLVEKKKTYGRIALFAPTHPERLKELLHEKQKLTEQSIATLQSSFGSLSSAYNFLQGKPNVQFFEGVIGIQHVYDDILEIGKDIFVISSPINDGRQEILHLIREQIKRQVEQNIKTKAITPIATGQPIATPIEEDEKHLITRKQVPAEKLHIPAQIIIYGDKVAITNFKETLITVLVESKYIAETFRIMFEYIWENDVPSNKNNSV